MCRPALHCGNRFVTRIAACAFFLVLAGGFGNLLAHDLATTDGLTVQMDNTGLVTGLQVNGDELLTTGVTGGFTITDYTGLNGTNLMANAGFEGGYTHWGDNIYVPDNWNLVTATGSAANIMLVSDSAGPNEGLNALRFVTTQSGLEETPLEPDLISVASDAFAVEAGANYYCKAACRSDQGYSTVVTWWGFFASVSIDWYDSGEVLISSDTMFDIKQSYYHWSSFTGWATAPGTAATAAIRVEVKGNVQNYTAATDLLFDNFRCFREPDGIRDIPATGTVTNTGGVLDLQAVNVGGRGLDLNARMEPLDNRIVISGTVTPSTGSEGQDRALDLAFILPVDTSSMYWFWHRNMHQKYRMQSDFIYEEVVAADATSDDFKLSVYNLSCIADPDHALNFARDHVMPRPYYVQYLAEEDLYCIRFQMGLAAERDHASFDFVLYTSPASWTFRGALSKYYEIYSDFGRLREINGEPVPRGIDGGRPPGIIGTPYETDPADFGVRFYHSRDAAEADYLVDTLGLKSLHYIQPWVLNFESPEADPPPLFPEFIQAVNEQPSVFYENELIPSTKDDFMISANDITDQDYLLYRVTNFPGGGTYQYFGGIYINPQDAAGPTFGDRYIDHLASVYDHYEDVMESREYLHGVMMDLSNIGSGGLDGMRSRFATAGYDLTYCPNNFEPALWNLNAFQNFMIDLKNNLSATQPGHDLIAANVIEYGYLFSAANNLDTFGFECSPITGWNWGVKNLDYRRILAGSKPFSPVAIYSDPLEFDDGSNEYEKGMRDLLNVSLLYGFYLDTQRFAELNGKDMDVMRETIADVIPYIDLFMALGWNPQHQVTLVNANDQPIFDSYLHVERFGPDPEVESGESAYIVVLYNKSDLKAFDILFPRPVTKPETKDFRIIVNFADIGMDEPVTLEEMSVNMHNMGPEVPPNLNITNNGNGTVTITGTVAWRDALLLKLTEYVPDTTPPAVPSGVGASVILP